MGEPIEDTRRINERHLLYELRHGEQAALAQKRLELMDHSNKSYEIDERQTPLKDQACEPIVFAQLGQAS